MNKKQLFTNSGQQMQVVYKTDELGEKASLIFMPAMVDEKIVAVPVRIQYDTWAPWMKTATSDSLLLRVLPMLERWHNVKFTQIQTPSNTPAWVRADGNRLIIVAKLDERTVSVLYKDLLAK